MTPSPSVAQSWPWEYERMGRGWDREGRARRARGLWSPRSVQGSVSFAGHLCHNAASQVQTSQAFLPSFPISPQALPSKSSTFQGPYFAVVPSHSLWSLSWKCGQTHLRAWLPERGCTSQGHSASLFDSVPRPGRGRVPARRPCISGGSLRVGVSDAGKKRV